MNSFWFFRELRRYGLDCVIVTPTELRDRFQQDLIDMLNQYSLQSIETSQAEP